MDSVNIDKIVLFDLSINKCLIDVQIIRKVSEIEPYIQWEKGAIPFEIIRYQIMKSYANLKFLIVLLIKHKRN
jgi:hypothetical protein